MAIFGIKMAANDSSNMKIHVWRVLDRSDVPAKLEKKLSDEF